MARRVVYGKSPWGEYFIQTLLSHYDEGRLQRGRTYANTGKVASVEITGPQIDAKVEGHYQPWYRVHLSFPPFSEGERGAVLSLVKKRPALLAAISGGELPMELIGELEAAGIDLLPRDWGRLVRSCNCPDYGDPCKHMAAVYYTLAREIDQNPFGLFLLRGLDLRSEFSLAEAAAPPPPILLSPRGRDLEASAPNPELALNDNFTSFILSVLRPAPAFAEGDFKTLLAEFYHASARRYEAALTLRRGKRLDEGRRLAETDFALDPQVLQETLGGAGGRGPERRLSLILRHPLSDEVELSLLDAAPAFLSAEDGEGSPSYRFFFYLYRLLYLILRSGAFVPAPDLRGTTLRVAWKPLVSVADVGTLVEAVGALCPPLLQLDRGGKRPVWADGRSTAEFLLTTLCTQYVQGLDFRGSDPVGDLFFSGKSLQTDTVAYRSTPWAIHSWVAVLDRRNDTFRYRFRVTERPAETEDRSRSYRLGVDLSRKGDGKAWCKLHQAASLGDAVAALSFASMLAGYLPELGELQGKGAVDLEENRLLFFLQEAAPVLRRLGAEVILPKDLRRALKPRLVVGAKKIKGTGSLSKGFDLNTLMAYDWKVAVGDTVVSLAEFRALLKEGRKIVRFKDGFLRVEADELRRLLERADRPPRTAEAVAAFLGGAVAFTEEAREAWGALFREKRAPLPRALAAELRPYQLAGYRWAWNNLSNGFGCLLADDMGLGKTVQAIAVLQKMKEEGRLEEGALVVVPASLLTNWRRELTRFAPELRVKDYYGPRRSLSTDQEVLLSTYETVLRDAEKLGGRNFSLLILDEAHGLKNAATKRAQAIRTLKVSAKLALSGTPVENRLEDLRAIFDLVLPGYLGDAATFRSAWRVPIELHRDVEAAEELKRITAPFLLRRLKTDPKIVPELPEKTVIDEYAPLSPSQAALYESALAELAGPGAEALTEPGERGALLFKLITALKQICNHPRAYDGESPLEADLSGKAKLLLDLLRSALEGGEKVLVFSQYVETLSILADLVESELGEACLVLHGGLSREQRTRAVDRFQHDAAYRIFLISLKAGGVGLNLTAASRVVHYDLWFNPAVENQATDRAFRIGQTRRVFVHRLISTGTFEEKIDAMIKAKRELAELSVAKGESWLADLAPQDLKNLFLRSPGGGR